MMGRGINYCKDGANAGGVEAAWESLQTTGEALGRRVRDAESLIHASAI